VMGSSPINFESYLRYELGRDIVTTDPYDDQDKDDLKYPKIKLHVFQPAKNQKEFKFKKELVKASQTSTTASQLTYFLRNDLQDKPQLQMSIDNRESREKTANTTLQIFLPTMEPVKIIVSEKARVEEVIKLTLQQYEIECSARRKAIRINLDAATYLLRFAEDDGSPDEDMPALVKTQEIGHFKGTTRFSLCLDTSFKRASTAKSNTIAPSLSLFRVFIPTEGFGGGWITVAYNKDTKLRDVMDILVAKRDFDSEKCDFDYFDDNDALTAKNTELTMDKKVSELGLPKLKLVALDKKGNKDKDTPTMKRHKRKSSMIKNVIGRKGASEEKEENPNKSLKRPASPGPLLKGSEYLVLKVKGNTKVERILGIESDKITKSKSDSPTKKPVIPILQIQKVSIDPKQHNVFYINLADKTYKFESDKAEEIVSKITPLLKNQK